MRQKKLECANPTRLGVASSAKRRGSTAQVLPDPKQQPGQKNRPHQRCHHGNAENGQWPHGLTELSNRRRRHFELFLLVCTSRVFLCLCRHCAAPWSANSQTSRTTARSK